MIIRPDNNIALNKQKLKIKEGITIMIIQRKIKTSTTGSYMVYRNGYHGKKIELRAPRVIKHTGNFQTRAHLHLKRIWGTQR